MFDPVAWLYIAVAKYCNVIFDGLDIFEDFNW